MGDTLALGEGITGLTFAKAVLYSTSSMDFDGQSFIHQFFRIVAEDAPWFGFDTFEVIEGIGCTSIFGFRILDMIHNFFNYYVEPFCSVKMKMSALISRMVSAFNSDIEEPSNTKYSLLPNPTNQILHLAYPVESSDGIVHILDLNGRVLLESPPSHPWTS